MQPAEPVAKTERKESELLLPFLLTTTKGDRKEAKRRLDEYLRGLRKAERAKPTPFEEVWTYKVMMDLAAQLKEVAPTVLPAVKTIPLFGTLRSGELNAMAIKVPESSEHIIVFQDGLFGFANLLTKAIAASLPDTTLRSGDVKFSWKPRQIKKGWATNDEPLRRLDEFLSAYIIGGHPHAAQQYFLDHRHTVLGQILLEGFELFIFGHEFGHVFAGHLDSALDAPDHLGAKPVERLSPSWKMEFEADYVGFALAMSAMGRKKFDPATSYAGIDLFFSSLELVHRATSMLSFGEIRERPRSATHPPPQLRRKMLWRHLDQIGKGRARQARRLASGAERILDMMWSRLTPTFEDRHKRGVRPAPEWL